MQCPSSKGPRDSSALCSGKGRVAQHPPYPPRCCSWQKDQDRWLAPSRLAPVIIPANLLQSHIHPAVVVSEHKLCTFEPRAVPAFKYLDDADTIMRRVRRCPFYRPYLLNKLFQLHISRSMHDIEIEQEPLPVPRFPATLDNVKCAVVFGKDVAAVAIGKSWQETFDSTARWGHIAVGRWSSRTNQCRPCC